MIDIIAAVQVIVLKNDQRSSRRSSKRTGLLWAPPLRQQLPQQACSAALSGRIDRFNDPVKAASKDHHTSISTRDTGRCTCPSHPSVHLHTMTDQTTRRSPGCLPVRVCGGIPGHCKACLRLPWTCIASAGVSATRSGDLRRAISRAAYLDIRCRYAVAGMEGSIGEGSLNSYMCIGEVARNFESGRISLCGGCLD